MENNKPYDDPSNWEYDGGSPNWTGNADNLSPYIQGIMDDLAKQAFPDGKEAYQEEMQKLSGDKSALYIEHFHSFFPENEHSEIEQLLDEHHIVLVKPKDGKQIKAAFLDGLIVIFNEPLTKNIMSDMLSAGAYDVIKKLLSDVFVKVHKPKGKGSNIYNFRFQNDNIKINASIPDTLEDNQFQAYMDMLKMVLIELGKTKISSGKAHEELVILQDGDTIKVETILDYAHSLHMKQTENKK